MEGRPRRRFAVSQFDVYLNPMRSRRDVYPYVTQLQSDLAAVNPREVIVAPLVPVSLLSVRGAVLLPVVQVAGEEFTVCVPMLGAVPAVKLGARLGEVSDSRRSLLGAVDRLFTGG